MEPPEELAEWHDALAAYLSAMTEVLAHAPGADASEDELDEYGEIIGVVFFGYSIRIGEIIEGMDRDTIAAMFEAGCLDESSLNDFFTEAEIEELGLGAARAPLVTAVSTGQFTSVSAGATTPEE